MKFRPSPVLTVALFALVLVFAKHRLYAPRDQRGGSARVLSATAIATIAVFVLVLVAGFNTLLLWRGSQLREEEFFSSGMKLALRAGERHVDQSMLLGAGLVGEVVVGAQRGIEVAEEEGDALVAVEVPEGDEARLVPAEGRAAGGLEVGRRLAHPPDAHLVEAALEVGEGLREVSLLAEAEEVGLVRPGAGGEADVSRVLYYGTHGGCRHCWLSEQ